MKIEHKRLSQLSSTERAALARLTLKARQRSHMAQLLKLDTPAIDVFMAIDESGVVGWASLEPILLQTDAFDDWSDPDSVYLINIFVKETMRQEGIATQLGIAAQKHVSWDSRPIVGVNANDAADSLYAKLDIPTIDSNWVSNADHMQEDYYV